MKAPEPAHLGDGVYAGFDGYHLTIAINDHRRIVAHLEPAVLARLIEYARSVDAAAETPHFGV